MQVHVGVLVGVVLVAACSGSSATEGDEGGGEPVPLVGATEQGLRVRIDVVGDREVHVRIPVDCVRDDAPGDEVWVPLERLVPAVPVEDDGSFRIEDTIEEDGLDGDMLHVDLRLGGRFDRDGTASGTVEATLRFWNGQAEGFGEPCPTGEVGWTAAEPARPARPDATVPLSADVMTILPLGDEVLAILDDGRVVRIDAAGGARGLDGAPVTAPADDPDSSVSHAAVAGEGVWVGGQNGADRHGLAGGPPTARIDPHLFAIEAGHGALWTVTHHSPQQARTLDRRDPTTGAVLLSLPVLAGPPAGSLEVDPSGVWYAYSTGEEQAIDRIDPATATVSDRHVLDADETPTDLATAADRVWLRYDGRDGAIVALDPATGSTAPVDLPTAPTAMTPAADGASLWALHPREAVARRIDAAGRVLQVLDLPEGGWRATTTPDALWLTGRDPDGTAQVLRVPT